MDDTKRSETLAFMDNFYNSAMKSRRPSEKRWLVNMCFFLGHQWLSWSNTKWMLYRPAAPMWRVRLVINKIFPNVLKILARISSKLPDKHVIPAKNEDDCVEKAKACEKLLKHLDRENEELIGNQKLGIWRIVYGLAYKDIAWDIEKGQKVTEPKVREVEVENEIGDIERQMQPIMNEAGEPETYDFQLGEVDVIKRSPFEVLWEPGIKNFRDSFRVMVLNRMTVESVREKYPKYKDEIKSEMQAGLSPLEAQLLRLMGEQPGQFGKNTGDEKTEGFCTVKELRELPSKKYPKGRLIRSCGKTLLKYEEKLPYEYMIKERCLGLMEYPYIDTGERVNGETPVTHAIPMQVELNKCVDSNTEALTPSGWKKYSELFAGERILAYDKEKDVCEWQVLEDIFIRNYKGFLNVLESTQISSRTTPEHKFVVKHKVKKSLLVTKNPNGEHSIPLIKPFKNCNSDNPNYSDDFIKIVGWAVTEGQYVKPRTEIDKRNGKKTYSNKITISQSEKANPDKTKQIRESLKKLGDTGCILKNELTGVVSFNLKVGLGRKIKEIAPNKLPRYDFLNSLSSRQLQILFDTIIAGDGHIRKSKLKENSVSFYNTDLALVEIMQYIGILLGKNPKLKMYSTVNKKGSFEYTKPFYYVLSFRIGRYKEYAWVRRAKQESVYYSGIIWCPTVKGGFWLCRRDGKVHITGNTQSQLVEIRNLMAKPKWVAYKESKISEDAITSEPGEVIQATYAGGVPEPHPTTPPAMPAYVGQLGEGFGLQIQDILSIHEVSRGEAPPGVKSGVAIRALQEQDQMSFGPASVGFEEREKIVAKWKLLLVKEMYKEPRLVKILGENDRIEVEEFIVSEDMPTDVYIVQGSSFTESKVARQELILSLFERGLFGDPTDESIRQRILRFAEVGGLEMLYQETMVDENEVKRENRLFEKGLVPTPQDFDNHHVHVQGHNIFRKSDAYRKLHPQIQQFIGLHVEIHAAKLPETQQVQQLEQDKAKQEMIVAEGLRRENETREDDRAKTSLEMMEKIQGMESPKKDEKPTSSKK